MLFYQIVPLNFSRNQGLPSFTELFVDMSSS